MYVTVFTYICVISLHNTFLYFTNIIIWYFAPVSARLKKQFTVIPRCVVLCPFVQILCSWLWDQSWECFFFCRNPGFLWILWALLENQHFVLILYICIWFEPCLDNPTENGHFQVFLHILEILFSILSAFVSAHEAWCMKHC